MHVACSTATAENQGLRRPGQSLGLAFEEFQENMLYSVSEMIHGLCLYDVPKIFYDPFPSTSMTST